MPSPTGRTSGLLMAEIVCFGELMLRLSAPQRERLFQSPVLEADFGGAEANVAVGLAQFGLNASFVTALPKSKIGDAAVRELSGLGVQTANICRREGRMGVYYVEVGAGYLPANVVYDRVGSALAETREGDFDWPNILWEAKWLHISGITPALSRAAAQATLSAVRAASALGVKVSCDANYRSALWNYGASPPSVMKELVKGVDVLIAGADDFREMLEISDSGDGSSAYAEQFERLSARAMEVYPNLKLIAGTLRDVRTASSNGWSGFLRSRSEFLCARYYEIDHIVDRIGTGDAFSAGLVYGLMTNKSDSDALEYAVAAGCLKHSIPKDFPRMRLDEVETLLNATVAARVRR